MSFPVQVRETHLHHPCRLSVELASIFQGVVPIVVMQCSASTVVFIRFDYQLDEKHDYLGCLNGQGLMRAEDLLA